MAVTPSSMILRSLRLIGEKEVAGTLATAEQTAYLADMNTMLDGWSIDPLLIPQLLQESLALTASVGSYEIGPDSSTWNTARPSKIVEPCFTRDSSNYDRPLILIDKATYGGLSQKTLDGSYPQYLYYEVGPTRGMIYLYPEPIAGLTLYINSWKALPYFQAITATLQLPAGYQRAIEFNFAVEVAGGFAKVSAEVAKVARDSLAAIKRINAPSGVLRMDPGLVGHGEWDINAG